MIAAFRTNDTEHTPATGPLTLPFPFLFLPVYKPYLFNMPCY